MNTTAIRKLPQEASILMVLIGIAALFEILGWIFVGQSFLANSKRLVIIVLQVSIIGIIAVGVTQVIITSGIDLSGGSVAALSAMVAASFAQASGGFSIFYPGIVDLPVIVPLLAGIGVGLLAGSINGAITAYTGVPPFIPTLGMLVAARGLAVLYAEGQPIFGLTEQYTAIGQGINPVLIFLGVAVLFHILLKHTVYGRRTYAIGSNEEAARIVGIKVNRHKVLVYSIAGGLAGLAGIVMSARATMGQPGMGFMYELDAISAAVIGGTSLFGGKGKISGTVIGVFILGVITSGFTFLRIDFYYQEIAKGMIIVAAVIADQRRQARKA
ncbi:Ribose transport system permease protein RbsC [Pseudovibrio sp. Ad13]|uniref:ABC transporter permease n=1 Tax=unclassified Pseudovibrio TaxID=2627060 RepID=UPI00070EE3F4|nr:MULTISPECIES: ABC transporter permease [unclassified Pseudovibrio]KZK78872.1 Ribose transport system permease protein RbsC [Pseudovibrio sp. Ad46]KZK84924.1 Ribose transport system permease protein RbsC [Pseudovibrio sp. Ad13]KZK93652.1 Ribose transport system permease protein RbsC [Pseudovibrio sp. Ad5]KZL17071.1 Ribose transport system permease protein RbsC [Pseudovibrio sp. Ad37]KZL20561.1 Ribose transport system permease protein RbsC [Pseudovibrio sp. WM33]